MKQDVIIDEAEEIDIDEVLKQTYKRVKYTKESKNKCPHCNNHLHYVDNCLQCLNMFCKKYKECTCELFGINQEGI